MKKKKIKIPFDKFNKPPTKIARDGNAHELALDATEKNIKFGLFLIAVMYFRGIYYLRRELREKEIAEKLAADKKAGTYRASFEEHKMATVEEMRELEILRKTKARQKKIDYVMVSSKIGQSRRITRERDELDEAKMTLAGGEATIDQPILSQILSCCYSIKSLHP